MELVVFLLLVLVLSASAVRAGVCPLTGEQAPAVVTLMASKTNPATDAWVVKPDCTVETYPLSSDNKLFATGSDASIERVDSLPTETTMSAFLSNAPMARGADLTRASKLVLVSVPRPTGLLLPNTRIDLSFTDRSLTSVADLVLPDALQGLTIVESQVKTLKGVKLPSNLKTLSVTFAKLTGIDFTIPPKLTELVLTGNSIPQLDRLALPSTLQSFECSSCGVTTVRGIKWPSSMQRLNLGATTIIENFEIRRSDLAVLKAIQVSKFEGKATQAKCVDSTAEIAVVAGKRLCVISDERFEQVYVIGNGVTPNAPAGSATTPSTSSGQGTTSESTAPSVAGESTAGSGGTQLPGSSGADATADPNGTSTEGGSGVSGVGSASGENSGDETNNGSSGPSTGTKTPRKTQPGTSTTDMATSSSSSNTTLVVGVGGGVIVVVLMVCVVGIVVRRRRAQKSVSEDKYDHGESPAPATHRGPAQDVYLTNDVRNDKALIPFRIEQRDVVIGQLVAQSKTSVVYKSSFQGRDVVVKQLRSATQHDKRTVSRFMDELRTCARLDHHKIVGFVGIAWSSLRDLSVVSEFMSGGDLQKLLYEESPDVADWSRQWTSLQIKSKASIAQDVAEAVVYLHSFNNPILHRNLKARNVLIDDDGSAKLSGFGVSREFAEDDTMTGEVGTVAWTAPEVLRGNRYDEKADIYSLGVLMVELDRCQHPYAIEVPVDVDGQTREQRGVQPLSHTNTQIAVLVSSGRLRPSVSSECPSEIVCLVAACLSFDPVDRPTSLEVCYVLRQARKLIEATIFSAQAT